MQQDSLPLLDGVRVLDVSRVLAGPFCTQLLGDLGARILKIERPGQGDETRAWGPPFVGNLSAYYLSCNRNKESIALDLASPEGGRILLELARQCDVFLENFLPASAAKLGLTPERLLEVNPRLIVCSLSGFGRTGPRKNQPGYDFAIQALSGFMAITGVPDGAPTKVGVAVADLFTGLYAATAVLACLHARTRSGHGYAIDLGLLDCAAAAQMNLMQAYLASGKMPARQGNAHLQVVPYQLFQTADDWLVLAVGNDGQWQRFCRAAERPDLAQDERFTTNEGRVRLRHELVPIVEALLRTKPRAAWEKFLLAADVPHAPVQDYAALMADPQTAARGMRLTVRDPRGNPVDLIGSPFHIAGAAPVEPRFPPDLGADTAAILHELLGMKPADIEALRKKGVVGGNAER